MLFGRLVGWVLLTVAVLMASGDAVLALGPGDHVGIVTGDVWMLLAGHQWVPGLRPSLSAMLMACPAWALLGPLGCALIWACRHRHRHRYLFRRIG
jgi:hypothetical protein